MDSMKGREFLQQLNDSYFPKESASWHYIVSTIYYAAAINVCSLITKSTILAPSSHKNAIYII
jgi:hypothetical protein